MVFRSVYVLMVVVGMEVVTATLSNSSCSCRCSDDTSLMLLKHERDEDSIEFNNYLIAQFLALQDVPNEFSRDTLFIEFDFNDFHTYPNRSGPHGCFSEFYGAARFGDPLWPHSTVLLDSTVSDEDPNVVLIDVPKVVDIPADLRSLHLQEVNKENIISDFQLWRYGTHWWGIFSVGMNWRNATLKGKYKNLLFCRDPGSFVSFLNSTSRRELGYKYDRTSGIKGPFIKARFQDLDDSEGGQVFLTSEHSLNPSVHNSNLLGNELVEDKLQLVPVTINQQRMKLVKVDEFYAEQQRIQNIIHENDDLRKEIERLNKLLQDKEEI